MWEQIAYVGLFLLGLMGGVTIFTFGYRVGRATKYQDMNVVPPPDVVSQIADGMIPKPLKELGHRGRPHGKSPDELAEERKRRGVIGPLQEPDLTKR